MATATRIGPWLQPRLTWARSMQEIWHMRLMKFFFPLPTISIDAVSKVANKLEPVIFEPSIKDDICLPPYYESNDHDDFSALMKIVTAAQPEIVLELGTGHGNTVANICRECPQSRVFTVNAPPDEISGEVITFALTRDEVGRVYRKHGFSERVVQIYCNTLELNLSQYLAGPMVDLAIVDACHDRPYVMHDFATVVPYMKPNGMVLLHDTHPSMAGHLWGSYTACMMLRRRGYDIRHIADTWWGIWVNTKAAQGGGQERERQDSTWAKAIRPSESRN